MEILVSALADAILGVAIGALAERQGISMVLQRLRGDSAKHQLQLAISCTMETFTEKFPDFAHSFFDDTFLKGQVVVAELAKLLTPNRQPNPIIIVQQWKKQFGAEPKFDATEPVKAFLTALEEEIKSQPVFQNITDSRALQRISTQVEQQTIAQQSMWSSQESLNTKLQYVLSVVVTHLQGCPASIPSQYMHLPQPLPDSVEVESEEITGTGESSQLDDNAQKIATMTASTLRVIAGPGTGKTFTLVKRLEYLLKNGSDPKRILFLTFTRTASAEMMSSLKKYKVPNRDRIVAGTLHSYCMSILHKETVLEQTGRSSRNILLKFEVSFLLEDLKKVGKLGGIRDLRKTLKLFEAAWAKQQDDTPGWADNEIHEEFDRRLNAWLRFHDAMLLEEIVPETLKYLSTNPESEERKRFEHVLIDEYQDLNKAEQVLVDLLRGHGTLAIIGDEDQSIYEDLRYAHPKGISSFHDTHKDVMSATLEVCRRCPKRVLELAKTLIKNNQYRTPKPLRSPENSPEGDIYLVQWETMEQEANGLAQFIINKTKTGEFQAGQILVVCSRRQFGQLIRDRINELGNGLQARSFFTEDEFAGDPHESEEAQAQEAFTLLRLAQNLHDLVALRCWLGFGHSALQASQYKSIVDYCSASGRTVSVIDVLDQLADESIKIPRTNSLVERYRLLLKRLEELAGNSARTVFDRLFPHDTKWAEPFRAYTDKLPLDATLDTFVETLRSSVFQKDLPDKVDYVRVMSLHKSKGLTADHVIIIGCIEGLIPMLPNEVPPEERTKKMEEQRRLFYVALTRTRKTLVLSSVVNMPTALAKKTGVRTAGSSRRVEGVWMTPVRSSQFINELGPNAPKVIPGKSWKY